MKRVLLLATTTGYQIRSFGEAAGALGVRLMIASDRCDRLEDPWWDSAIAVRFHDLDQSTRAVIEACAGNPPDGVLAVGDRPTVLAAHVSSALGLPGNPPHAADASRNKLASRRALASAGLPTPSFHVLGLAQGTDDLPPVSYPSVVKPLALSGSRGVMRVDDREQLAAALERLRRLLQSPDVAIERDAAHQQVLIETFIPGVEYAVEGILTRGTFRCLAIFDKPDAMNGPFFEETIYVTPSRASDETQRAIVESVERAAAALGLWHGPVHAECRVNDRGVYVLEVAARPIGGLCSRALRFESVKKSCISLEEMLLCHATGEDVSDYRRIGVSTGVMMIPIPRRGIYRGVNGVDSAKQLTAIDDVLITAKPDSVLVPLPEGRSYLGFVFATANNADVVERSLRAAHAMLQFQIDREVSIVP